MIHDKSSGMPETPDGDLGGFAPTGEPQNLNRQGGEAPRTEADVEAALAEFARIAKSHRSSSLRADGERITIPSDGGPGDERS